MENFRAISILEYGLLSSPVNFHIKILLVRFYLEVGLVIAADHIFTLLDVKHLQLDSLGHLYAPLLAPLGNLPQASTTLDHTTKFFMTNYKDVCFFKHNVDSKKIHCNLIYKSFFSLECRSFDIRI